MSRRISRPYAVRQAPENHIAPFGYTSIARAQLSRFELLYLFYNCLTPGGEKFYPLVEEFGLLEHFDREALLLHPSHEGYYKNAYK